MRKFSTIIMLVTAFLFLMAGCKKDEPQEAAGEPEENPDPVVEEPVLYEQPLTGLLAEEPAEHRVISVMVNNHPQARPQSGLHKADIVYEVLAEGGVTRFLAVYQSEMPEIVGPIRSARDYYIELAKGYDSVYIAHGYSPSAKELLDQGYVDNINGMYYDGTLFQRADFRKAPHNSYITYENIAKGAEEKGYPLNGAPEKRFFLAEGEEAAGETVPGVTIDYSNQSFLVRYDYDEFLQAYKRFSGDVQTADYETNDPVLINNVFIVETNHSIIDDAGRLSIDLKSGGRALLLQKGKLQEIEWKNIDGILTPYINGKAVPLVPGKTWVNIVKDIESTVDYNIPV